MKVCGQLSRSNPPRHAFYSGLRSAFRCLLVPPNSKAETAPRNTQGITPPSHARDGHCCRATSVFLPLPPVGKSSESSPTPFPPSDHSHSMSNSSLPLHPSIPLSHLSSLKSMVPKYQRLSTPADAHFTLGAVPSRHGRNGTKPPGILVFSKTSGAEAQSEPSNVDLAGCGSIKRYLGVSLGSQWPTSSIK